MNRILIAEDELQLRMGIALSLKTIGYEVIESSNGADALQEIIKADTNQTPFDCFICDVQMPKMTGEEVLQKLTELSISLPTIIITGYGEKELLIRLMRAGCRDFIDKPFEPDLLCNRVTAILSSAEVVTTEKRRINCLAAIGERTLQTAHDLNNMLGLITGHTDMALGEIGSDHPTRNRLQKIIASSARAADICKKLLSAHPTLESTSLIATEMNSLISRVGVILTDIAPVNVDVSAMPLDHVLWMKANSERLQQALLNLGLNAFAALPDGGNVSISIVECAATHVSPSGEELNCVVISVADNGCGIPGDIMDKLFKKGLGSGLSIVK
jgi:FixJ family two-component response regulator